MSEDIYQRAADTMRKLHTREQEDYRAQLGAYQPAPEIVARVKAERFEREQRIERAQRNERAQRVNYEAQRIEREDYEAQLNARYREEEAYRKSASTLVGYTGKAPADVREWIAQQEAKRGYKHTPRAPTLTRYGELREPLKTVRSQSTLDTIVDRINASARQIQELGYKLDSHADAVHGGVPRDEPRPEEAITHALAALDRIFYALDGLDAELSYMAQAAGRNCTLA